jgi:ATP-binding cassette subfamily B protein
MAQADTFLRDFVQGAEAWKSLGSERAMRLRWEKQFADTIKVKRQSDRLTSWIHLTNQLLQALALTVMLWLGANRVIGDELSTGQLIAILLIAGLALSALADLGEAYRAIIGVLPALQRNRGLWELSPEQTPSETISKIVLPELKGSVTLKNLCFRYQEGAPYVLENINFTVRTGETVLVIGPTGSGKSTWAKLLLGLYLPSGGSLSIDGYALDVLDRPSLRTQIGYVPQRDHLFSETIAQNIALSEEVPDMKRMAKVCKAVGLDGFIEQLPLHYETLIHAQEHGFSQEQLKRLMLARSLYREPSLWILDDPTGNLDHQGVESLLNLICENRSGKTILVFSRHPLPSLQPDQIVLLTGGRVVESGPPDELIASQGLYYQIRHPSHENG